MCAAIIGSERITIPYETLRCDFRLTTTTVNATVKMIAIIEEKETVTH